MKRHRPSAIRHLTLWWFRAPSSPWVSLNIGVDFGPAQAYLAALAQDAAAPRVSVQHLLTACVGRTLAAFPMANATVIGDRIVPRARVGVGMPVNLLGHAGGAQRELGAAVVGDAGRSSLREIARASRAGVEAERTGRPSNPVVRWITRAGELLPRRVLFRQLDAFERLRGVGPVPHLIYRLVPATTVLSNVGAAVADAPGVVFRGGAVSPPLKLAHVGTVWGVGAVQDEVVAVDGVPAVRPVLPVLLVFDHRLIDGVVAARVAAHFGGLLRDPAAAFGPTGAARG